MNYIPPKRAKYAFRIAEKIERFGLELPHLHDYSVPVRSFTPTAAFLLHMFTNGVWVVLDFGKKRVFV
jgi:hypothetical protein